LDFVCNVFIITRILLQFNTPLATLLSTGFFVDNWAKGCSNNLYWELWPMATTFIPVLNHLRMVFPKRHASSTENCFKKCKILSQSAIKPVFLFLFLLSKFFPFQKTLGEFRIIFELTELNKNLRFISYG